MRLAILSTALFISLLTFGQSKTYFSDHYQIKMKYPSYWEKIDDLRDGSIFSISLPPKKIKTSIMTTYDITVKDTAYTDDLEGIGVAYRKELYSRDDFDREEILTDETITFHGIEAIDIKGRAKFKIVNKWVYWRILLFKYNNMHIEVSYVAGKGLFKNKNIQQDFQMMHESFKFLKD